MISKSRITVLSAAVLLGMSVFVLGTGVASAEENGLVAFFRKVFKYPVKTGENVANTVGATGSHLGGAGEALVRNTGATLSGDTSKAGQIVAEPAAKTANAGGALVSGTVGAPIKAAEDVQKEEK